MKFRKYIFLIFLFYSYMPVLAQVDTAWVRSYNGPACDEGIAITVDISGNVYATGTGSGGNDSYDYVTIKYYPNGDTAWVRSYAASGVFGNDVAYDIAVDSSGNVYVTGESVGGESTLADYATVKYYANGQTAWARRYNGPGNNGDQANAIALDHLGNVYVTGRSLNSSGGKADCVTIKYYPNGDTAWLRVYNGPQDKFDQGQDVTVDDSGNVYVAGSIDGDYFSSGADIAIIKYYADGDTAWVRRYNGPGNSDDGAFAIAIDVSNNIFVTGFSRGSGTLSDCTTIKYYPNGDTAWVRRYNNIDNLADVGYEIVVDDSNNVYVTGATVRSSTSTDYLTIKYYPNGDTAWVRTYNKGGGVYDISRAIALDQTGNVYVTGKSANDFVTIKYDPEGNTGWVQRYGDGFEAADIAVDNFGNVYVTGEGFVDIITYCDFATIKYAQFICSAKPGDVTGDGNVLLPDIVAIIDFLFKSAPAPNPLCRGDANVDGKTLLSDIVHLINFLFKSGPAPLKSKECCL